MPKGHHPLTSTLLNHPLMVDTTLEIASIRKTSANVMLCERITVLFFIG